MYTWDGKHLYYGMGTNEMDMLCTFNGKELYCDNHSITPNNVIITWDGHNIYTVSGDIPIPILVFIM